MNNVESYSFIVAALHVLSLSNLGIDLVSYYVPYSTLTRYRVGFSGPDYFYNSSSEPLATTDCSFLNY